MCICFPSFAGLSARGQVEEYLLKAAFLYKFALFVEWPPETFVDAKTPITIGIFGSDPFGKRLDEMVQDEVIRNLKLDVERYNNVDEIIKMANEKHKIRHILFVSQSESGKLDRIFASLRGRHILTVGESDRFVRSGGIIRFATEKNKIQLMINLDNAKSEKLTISSKLLRVAELMENKRKE